MEVTGARRVERPSWANLRTVLGLLLFCGALLAGQRLLQGAQGTTGVWAAARDLAPDTRLDQSDLQVVQVRLPEHLAARYLGAGDSLEGAVLQRPALAGELLSAAWVSEPASALAGRAMTVPVEPEHAVGGALRPGDRVDVLASFNAGDGRARTIPLLQGVEIRDVVRAGGLVSGEESLVGVTVAVAPDEAVRLAFAIRNAEIDVVRVDGASGSSGDGVSLGDFP